MIPNNIKAILTQKIPAHLIKEREQGKTTLTYISGSTVIGILNQAFSHDWDWTVEREWIESSQDKYDKYKNEYVPQSPIAHVRGTLTVRYKNEDGTLSQICKTGHGSKVIIGGASEQDSIFKAASTDALKKAASMLGVGLQLYRDENEINYFEAIEYVDPWTTELREAHKADWDFIEDFKTRFPNGDEALSQYIYAFSNAASSQISYITPERIGGFVAYCKAAL